MALAISPLSEPKDGPVKVDIICVPAIGADPRNTWARDTRSAGYEHQRLDCVLHDKLYPDAQTYLYDHLTQEERRLEIIPSQGGNDLFHTRSAETFAAVGARLADYGVVEWAERFLEVVQKHRQTERSDQRPILFLCHSTGGIVLKQALSRKLSQEEIDIAGMCLGVTFFATPHHGSSVLSEPEYIQTVQDQLGLKWEMSETLRRDFSLRNRNLESLNYKFAVKSFGVKIYSYVESIDTDLKVLSTNDAEGENLTNVRFCIVDSRAGQLGTPEIPVEDEEVITLNANHVGAPRFSGEDILYGYYIDAITSFIKGFSAEERAAYHDLNSRITTGIEVDIHQFYEIDTQGGRGSMKILSAHPSLQMFLELGPTKCMEDRLRGIDGVEAPKSNGSVRPSIESRPALEHGAPTFTVTAVDSEKGSHDALNTISPSSLAAPATAAAQNSDTRRPSLTVELEIPRAPGHLKPKQTKTVQFQDADQMRRPQKKHLFRLPSRSSGRFKWIHVPFTHAGWVPQILTSISQDKGNLDLHSKVLMDKLWFSQHNRSRHASPHARFVKPSVKSLLPRNAEGRYGEGLATPTSATDDIQFVAYLPYLHWDSFRNLKKRATIIKRRRAQAHASPIAKDIALGNSMEDKLIWQHLISSRPIHCRRTLDQYGYPSLRNTSVRDGDQILYKRTRVDVDALLTRENAIKDKHRSLKGRRSVATGASASSSISAASADETAKVLMVDQMWLWIIDGQHVITFFAPKEKEDDDNGLSREGDVRSEIYQDINGDYANQCRDPYDFAALAAFHAVKALLDNNKIHDRDLQVFRIFEEYISILTEQQTSSFKQFRNNHRFENAKEINAQSHIDNRRDLDALLELRDIDDELCTIQKLIGEQQTCITDMVSQYMELRDNHAKGVNGLGFLHEAQQFLNDHHEQIVSMLKGARTAQRAFKELLDMKQKQANIVEAHLAREQTQVAAEQSRAVMIFTIFTIIFLPLSFFASVFGINSKEWSGGNYPHLHTIFTYMGAISVAVIAIALLVAFNRFSRRMSQRFWKLVAMPFLATLQRVGIIRRTSSSAADAGGGGSLDLEKAAVMEKERTESKSLAALSRTYTMNNWEEELKLHRQSFAKF